MQEVDIKGLEQIDRLAKKLKASPEIMREARRKAFEEAAEGAKKTVDRHIGGRGRVKSWQEAQVGSRGGYAKVQPKADTWTEPTKKEGNQYAVGTVTNAIVSGHAFPGQGAIKKSRRKYYKDAAGRQNKVPAKPFYDDAEPEIQALARETAEKVVRELMDHLEDES